MCEQARKLCLLGATTPDLADFFNVSKSSIEKWLADIPVFAKAVNSAKAESDSMVVRRLFERATGYSHPEVHVSNYQGKITLTPLTKHYAPDTTAAIFWLKNRQPALWRERTELTGKDGDPLIPAEIADDMELARRVAFMLTAAAIKKANESSKEPTA